MKRRGMIGALALVVIVNGIVLAGVARNRATPPEASLTLTERELPISRSLFESDENSGVAVQLRWGYAEGWEDLFGSDKLRLLGFTSEDVGPGVVDDSIRKVPLSRYAYAVLEYDGPAWAAVLRRKEKDAAKEMADVAAGKRSRDSLQYTKSQLQYARRSESRLVLIDLGKDPHTLRARYADNHHYLIAPAEVHVIRPGNYESVVLPKGEAHKIRCNVSILTGTISVPTQFQAILRSITGAVVLQPYPMSTMYDQDRLPRYQVTIHAGQRYEPWVVDIAALADIGK